MNEKFLGLDTENEAWLQMNANVITKSVEEMVINTRIGKTMINNYVKTEYESSGPSPYMWESWSGNRELRTFITKDGRIVYERVTSELWKDSEISITTGLFWEDDNTAVIGEGSAIHEGGGAGALGELVSR